MEADFDEMKEHMYTLSETMNHMRKKGYENDFQMTDQGIACKHTNEIFKPEELTIKKVFRFEGESNPEDMSILYLMEANSGTKGLFVDAYGPYASTDFQGQIEFLKKVKKEEE